MNWRILRVYVQKNTWNDAAYIGFSTWDYTPSDAGGDQAEFVWNEQERTVTVTGQKASGRQFSAVLTYPEEPQPAEIKEALAARRADVEKSVAILAAVSWRGVLSVIPAVVIILIGAFRIRHFAQLLRYRPRCAQDQNE